MTNENLNPLQSAKKQIKIACDKLGLEQGVYELLSEPKRVIEISIPVKMDDGSIKVFKGYRSVYNDAAGPGKGGIRFHQDVNKDEVMALSAWMAIKCSILSLPYGGGKGGVTVDPSTLSKGELERLSRGYIQGIHKYLGEKIDVPAPDANTNGQIMAWMTDEYIKLTGNHSMGVITGKPVEWGGSEGRGIATGFGVSIIAREVSKKIGIEMKNATVAVQGFGNVGSFSAKCLQDLGAKTVAIAKRDFAIYKEDGMDIAELIEYNKKNRDVLGFPGTKKISLDEFWTLKVDILVPAALENAINVDNVDKINAKLICEGANGPISPAADEILNERGIIVAPDILANAGGVTVSYFEWVQNLYGYYWKEEEVLEKEEHALLNSFNDIWATKEEYKVSFREAAYMYSVKRIANIMKLRGWY
ncbi:Glu/Leu/Phe/Val dehydrogenase [Tissierella creatinini]|nr:Glu/Leu/Phe/Val dehydrogenase [Tissierella creatinini]TJX66327.1 Glu/Leu/Phe/Val dehydrogenase [Soehngenia saccharolytica]